MALSLKDRVRESSTTTGTGTITLTGAYVGFRTFASAVNDGDTVYYTIHNTSPGVETEWEVGLGTFTLSGTTLSRDTILSSSNTGSAVNFSAGTKEVFITQPAEKAVFEDGSNNVTVGGKITVGSGPASDLDVATKGYVDNATSAALHYHDPVRVESPIALTAAYDNGTAGVGATLTNSGTQAALVIDGITMATSDRVLVYQQSNAAHNGVYTVTDIGSGSTNWVLTRATDADSYNPSDPDSFGAGDSFYVQEGATGAGESYVLTTTGTITFGTTEIHFSQFSATPQYTGTGNIDVTGQVISLTGTVAATNGGTGTNTYTTGDILYSNATNSLAKLAGNTTTTAKYLTQTGTGSASAAPTWTALAASATTDTTNASNISSGTLPSGRLSGSYTGITGVGTLTAGTWTATTVGVGYGGTGLASYTVGDIVYASGTTTLSKLADVATGNALISGGVGAAPSYGKIGLTTHVTGILPIANGGTNSTTADGGFNNLAPSQTGNSGKFLTTNGSTTSWGTPTAANNGTLSMGVSGTGLSGSATFTADQAGNSTFTVTSNATSANTASTIVARDASGNFTAGTITGNLSGTATNATNVAVTTSTSASAFKVPFANTTASTTGNYGLLQDSTATFTYNPSSNTLTVGTVSGALSGNATTATTLQTARTINGTSFNGSANITVTANTTNTLTRGSYLTGSNFNGSAATTWDVDATSANTASKVVARDASGNFSAGTVTAALSGNATTATTLATARTINGTSFNGSANITVEPYVEDDESTNATRLLTFVDNSTAGYKRLNEDSGLSYNPSTNTLTTGTFSGALSGNATTATTLQTARTIALSGAATGTATSFNGSANITIPVTALNASNLSSGTVPDARLTGTYTGITLQTNGGNTHYTTPNSGSASTNDRTVFGLAQYKSDSSAATGAIVFYAPNTNSTIMHRLRIEGMIYSGGPTVMCVVQGYRTTGAWSNTSKINLGITDVQVRFGVDASGKNCVILGDVGTTWSYPMMAITHAMFSHSGASDAYCKDWTVGLVTSLTGFTNVTSTLSNTALNTSISGNAATATTATTLATARTINGVSFNGSANIVVEPYIEDDNTTNATRYIIFTDNSTAGYKRLNEDSNLTYNPSTNTLTASTFSGNATTATTATTANALNTSNNYQVNSLGVGTAGSGTAGEIRATNNVTAYYASDARLKENVEPIGDALEKLDMIRGVTYDWTDSYIEAKGGEDGYFVRKNDVGVIAQEVERVLPQIVGENAQGFKAVRYERLTALLVEAVKELRSEVQELRAEVKALKGE